MVPARNVIPDQGHLIGRGNRFLQKIYRSTGLELNYGGICSGLSTLYVTHKCKGEGEKFFGNLKKLNNLTYEEYKAQSSGISDFIQRAQFAFVPHAYNKDVEQGDVDKIYHNYEDGYVNTNKFGIVVDCDKFSSLLNECMNDGEGVHLAANGHAISLYKRDGKYYVYDPNFSDVDKDDPHMTKDGDKVYDSVEDFANEVRKCVFADNEATVGIKY